MFTSMMPMLMMVMMMGMMMPMTQGMGGGSEEVKAYLEPVEVEKLEQTAEFLRDKLLIRLLFHLGCRVSEVLGIRVEDIDFKQGTVTIEHLKARIKLSCPQCGAGLGKMHKFCPVCGLKVEKAVAQEKEHRRYRVITGG